MKYIGYTLLVGITIFAGLTVGYVALGHRPLGEVFELGTWRHLIDLVFAD